ncbi:MAG: ABC transporter substrate-binding protein, partial [Lachnospiraceae bacterium]|nr:ABC transporter substrate-binding protein [Lachnospiraceae bacterium]
MKKKVLSLILAATMVAGAFAGCGSTGAKKQKTETKKDNGKGYEDCTLKMDWWGGDSRHEATQNAVKGFMQKYPGINVEVNFGAWSDWETAKAAEYTSGTNPDVQQTNFDWIGKYDASGDTYLDLNTVKDALDLSQWSKSD